MTIWVSPLQVCTKAKSQLMITMQVQRLHKKEEDKSAIFVEKFFEKWNLSDHIVNAHQKKKPYICEFLLYVKRLLGIRIGWGISGVRTFFYCCPLWLMILVQIPYQGITSVNLKCWRLFPVLNSGIVANTIGNLCIEPLWIEWQKSKVHWQDCICTVINQFTSYWKSALDPVPLSIA